MISEFSWIAATSSSTNTDGSSVRDEESDDESLGTGDDEREPDDDGVVSDDDDDDDGLVPDDDDDMAPDDDGVVPDDDDDDTASPVIRLDVVMTPACPGDQDCDEVPDLYDPFPADAQLPGTVPNSRLYAITDRSRLSRVHPDTMVVLEVAALSDEFGAPVAPTDLAIDRYGVVYVVTETSLYTCHPTTGECFELAPDLFGAPVVGAGFVPWVPSTDEEESLVVVDREGGLYAIGNRALMPWLLPIGGTLPYVPLGDVDAFQGTVVVTVEGDAGRGSSLISLASAGGFEPNFRPLIEVSLGSGLEAVEGLAVAGDTFYFFNSRAYIGRLDLSQNATPELFAFPLSFQGAAWHP